MERPREPVLVMLFGLIFAAVISIEILVVSLGPYPMSPEFVIGLATGIPAALGLLVGGYELSRRPFSPERQDRVLKWCLGGTVVFVAVNVGMMLAIPPATPFEMVGWLRWAASLGGGTGFLIGFYEAKAIHREAVAQRSAVRAEELEHRRELLDYLNALLRHEVLNTANVIEGYAELLEDTSEEGTPTRKYAGIIGRQTTDLTRVTKDVRILLRTVEEEPILHRTNLSEVLNDELVKITDRYEGVETDVTVPEAEETYVRADDLLRRIFSNLLSNAVEHNDAPTPRVSVTVSTTEETVVVRVADNGPGIPEAERDGLFDTTTGGRDHGIGLTIIGRLAERYEGSVELTETGPDGSVFSVELPRAE
ncbi:Signal transduction histidine kinase [Halopelagius inordinatus]|uniref:histidine kinase n=1 Tax=Halopelagius inordinatus TaxID=553467 RepID=A0A1I2SA83_9EURY|nr:ATP-binding protein [Halopelagius inordinatus]SFG49718.1 Signal transduction histidine kinase [Halopelagius inordinatus]